MTKIDTLRAALSSPERVRSVKLDQGVAVIIGDATGLSKAQREALEEQWKGQGRGIAGVTEVRVAMTASKVTRQVIAVGSGKGGVGKSTVAANLAIGLACAGRKVGLVDADIYGPSIPTLLGEHRKPDADKEKLFPQEAYGIRFLSVGNLVKPGQALAWRGPMASQALNQLIAGEWGDCDTLVIDLPPGTGDIQISLVQKARPDGAVIVSTPQDLSMIDATRAIDLFNKVEVPVLGIIENMAGYACPKCGEVSDPFGSGGAEKGAAELSVPFLGRLPLALDLRTASDSGKPPAAGDGPLADAFAQLARSVLAELEKVGA